jgi:hypothetical protein
MAETPHQGASAAVALALTSGRTIKEAAADCKAGDRTVKRWLAEQPSVVRRAAELRAEMVSRALGRAADGMAAPWSRFSSDL